jgi:DNA-binding response OmpR family regulator
MSHTERVIGREELLINVWQNINVDIRTIDVHIKNLRTLVGKDNIVTIMKVGYIWKNN